MMQEKQHSLPNDKRDEDHDFELSLKKYINEVVTAEKKEYDSPLQPFSVKEREIRTKIEASFRYFKKSFSSGYRFLMEELKHEMEMSETKEDLLELLSVKPEKLNLFEDIDALVKAFEEGGSI
jgi:hypothetical protein